MGQCMRLHIQPAMNKSAQHHMNNNAAHLMRPAMRPNALPAMNNSAQLFMKHLMNRSVQQATRRSALEVMEDMVDMERSARRFPSKAARVSQSRNHPRNATRCQRRTADRFQRRTALKCLFKNQPKLPNKSV